MERLNDDDQVQAGSTVGVFPSFKAAIKFNLKCLSWSAVPDVAAVHADIVMLMLKRYIVEIHDVDILHPIR